MTSGSFASLPLRVPAHADEPAHGLLARLSARHRESDVAAFAASLRLSFERVARGHQTEAVAALVNADAAALERASPSIDAPRRTVRLGGDSVRLGDWSTRARRFCPACIAADRAAVAPAALRDTGPYHRFWWDVRSIGTCPSHRMDLEDRCRACGAEQGWRAPLGSCGACGADLASRAPRSGSVRPSDAYAVARLTGGAHAVAPLIDALPLGEALGVLERLGTAVSLALTATKPRLSRFAAREARDRGLTAIWDWPASLERALDAAVCIARRDGRMGVSATYGWLYDRWAATLGSGPFDDALRQILRSHAVAAGVIADGEEMLAAGDTASQSATVTVTAAARELGWSFGRTRRVVARLGLLPRGSRRGVAARLNPGRIAALRSAELTVIGRRELGARLGIGKVQARRLAASGLIVARGDGDRIRPGDRPRRADVDAFVSAIAGAAPVRTRVPAGAVPLPDACRRAGVDVTEACRRILDGRARPVGRLPGVTTLATVLVRWRDLRCERTTHRVVSVEEAARSLDLHHETVRHLVREGLIATESPGRRGRVNAKAVLAFGRRHMGGTEAARRLATSPKASARILREAGVRPVAAPPACRQYVYGRSEVERGLSYLKDSARPGIKA